MGVQLVTRPNLNFRGFAGTIASGVVNKGDELVALPSGKTSRVRLNRGGDRQANSALHLVIIGRLANHRATQDYMARRTAEGKEFLEITRCLKRYLARTIYRALRTDLMTT